MELILLSQIVEKKSTRLNTEQVDKIGSIELHKTEGANQEHNAYKWDETPYLHMIKKTENPSTNTTYIIHHWKQCTKLLM
jgi:hypothetical protein